MEIIFYIFLYWAIFCVHCFFGFVVSDIMTSAIYDGSEFLSKKFTKTEVAVTTFLLWPFVLLFGLLVSPYFIIKHLKKK